MKRIFLFIIVFFVFCIFSFCASPSLLLAEEPVLFVTEDGVEVHGAINQIPSQKGTMVFLHSLDGDKEDWEEIAKLLHKDGWGTVSFDFRGHGESLRKEKEVINWRDFSKKDYYSMLFDVKAVCEFLRKEGVSFPVLAGKGIGANLAVNYAAKDKNVRALVLYTPGLSYRGVRCERPLYFYGDRPVLIIVSKDDKFSYDTAMYLSRIAQGPVHLAILSHAKTDSSKKIQQEKLMKSLIKWLDRVHNDLDGLRSDGTVEEDIRGEDLEKAAPDIEIDFRK